LYDRILKGISLWESE